jgi:drug/metabolite transporter (DMT)-like permease
MFEKLKNNIWFLLIAFFIITALAFNVVIISLRVISKPSSGLLILGALVLFLTITSYSFWTFAIAKQIIKIIKNKLNKK